MKRTTAHDAASTRCWSSARCSTAFPLLWMVSVSFMPHRRGEHLSAAAAAGRADAATTIASCSRSTPPGATCSTARWSRRSRPLISLVFNTMAGYAFAKLRFAGRERIFRGAARRAGDPGQVAMIPLFALVKELGLVSTYGGVIVPAMASVFGIFLVRQYALSLPDELLEAARIDGASEARIFWSLVVPLLRPDPGHAGDPHVPRDLERLHVAVDRADRPEAAHAAGRAGRAVARARAGQRADDGRRGDHGRAGAGCCSWRCSATTSRAFSRAASRDEIVRMLRWAHPCCFCALARCDRPGRASQPLPPDRPLSR